MIATERYEVRPAAKEGKFFAWDTANDQPVYLPGQGLLDVTSKSHATAAVTALNRAYAGELARRLAARLAA